MLRFKKKKLVLAIVSSGLFPAMTYALPHNSAQDLSVVLWANAGFGYAGSVYVPENEKLQSTEFFYLRNFNPKNTAHDTALYLLDKNSSLTLPGDSPGAGEPGFKSSVISSYTDKYKSGIAVKIGSNSFTLTERPILTAEDTDFFADAIGLQINSGVVNLKGVAISALDKGIDIYDIDADGTKGVGSRLNLENFSIKFDAARFNELVKNVTGTAANFTDKQKTDRGVLIGGTGVKGETVAYLTNGEIEVEDQAISIINAAAVYVDRVKISTTKYPGSSTVSASGKDSYVSIKNSEITTKATGVQSSGGEIDIENTLIERRGYGFGVLARYGGKLSIKNSKLTLTGGTQSGDLGFTSAAVSVREKDSKVTLFNVEIEDQISNLTTMKGIYADLRGEVEGTQVKYKTASPGALGVQIADNAKVSLTDSVFELEGAQSVGVFSGGGDFTADHSMFTSKGALLRIYANSSDASYIHLKNNSVFASENILLRNDSLTEEAFLTADHSLMAGRINGGFNTDVTLNNHSEWSYSGTSNFRNLVLDNSIVKMNKPDQGQFNTLEVSKLQSQKGTIQLWTEFSGDASISDKIMVMEEATGKTGLSFKKAVGTGEQTQNGIKVVDAIDSSAYGGPVAVTGADAFFIDASSDGYRQGKGTIAVGAYEYALKKGGSNADESWYLQSEKMSVPGPAPEPLIRPEVDIYFANRASMLNMQQHHLKQRVMDGWQAPVAWVRLDHKQEKFNNQFDFQRKSDMNLAHFGIDVLRKDLGDKGLLQLGVMGLIGQNKSKLRNDIGNAKGKTDGYNLGAYASWYQKLDGNTGAYVESWLMHGWFNNSTQGNGLAEEKYKSRALSLSLEAGYGFELPWRDTNHRYTLQPQAQLVLSHLHSDDVYEKTKTQVRHENGSQAAYRVGVRFQGDTKQSNGSVVSPFAELNLWHQPQNKDIRFDSKAISDQTPSTITEAVLGVKMRVKPSWDISGQFNYQQGSQSYKQKIVQLGVRYQWQ
ncbi:autotransporter outer membrane beta-barrel domain-containing protein [Comamonas sp. GB3 AK4-5]|uniref:autotransporter family protein n=1 Tax=Comamonas sp. GB3 AK4-5 TaxID=3231487 RepID=UPI00351EE3DC